MNFLHELPKSKILDREEFILKEIKGKTVLHLGAVDLYDSGICSLHKKLSKEANVVFGLDNDKNGILEAKKLGIDNIFYFDVEKSDKQELPFSKVDFDLILATEIIEHLFNPSIFLSRIRMFFSRNTKMIITTPNGLALHRTLYSSIFSKEYVHPDHTCYYTYTTLKNLLLKNGFAISDFYYYSMGRFFEKSVYRFIPVASTGLIFKVELLKS